MELAPGTVVDRYTVERLLGEGGVALVYLARHNELHTVHALKVLSISSPSVKARLLREGRVQAQLRHPNVVNVTDVVDVSGDHGLVMDYVRGPTLFELLAHNQLDTEQADSVAVGVLSGVRAAHEAGLIHRDLKPANVLIDARGGRLVPKVADFGLAKIASGGLRSTRSGVALGTPSYMAPEQIRSAKDVDHRADVFALGAILYELYCGAQAFPGGDVLDIFKRVTSGAFIPPREHVPGLPDRVERAIVGALAVAVQDRIPTVQALIDILLEDAPTALSDSPWDASILESVREISEELPALQPDKTPGPMRVGRPVPYRGFVALSVGLASLGLGAWWLTHAEKSRPVPVVEVIEVAEPPPVIAVRSEPKVAPKAPRAAPTRVVVEGDVPVELVGGGDTFRPGEVPPGAYELRALLDGRPMVLGQVVAVEGETVEMLCSAAMMVCRTAPAAPVPQQDVWADPALEDEPEVEAGEGEGSPWADPG
ncbi:MAG: serine/threonine protein kinase [Proteobacteria bacterium]|nr:serine/threonine protein kinase [Pseudomonadota bacterium]